MNPEEEKKEEEEEEGVKVPWDFPVGRFIVN